jgi:hypothetical protein
LLCPATQPLDSHNIHCLHFSRQHIPAAHPDHRHGIVCSHSPHWQGIKGRGWRQLRMWLIISMTRAPHIWVAGFGNWMSPLCFRFAF